MIEQNSNVLQKLRIGQRYIFKFSHRKGGLGIVCDVDRSNETFVVFDMESQGYETIPLRRLRGCENA